MVKFQLSAFLFFLSISAGFSQTQAGFVPPNFKEKVPETTTFYTLSKIDNNKEKANAALINATTSDKMMRFGKEVPTDINFMVVAEKFVQPNGRTIYQYGISSKGALSLNFILENFYLAEDARLFLTDPATRNFIGAYTDKNNNAAEVLGTELLATDQLVLVLDEPANPSNPSRFHIKTIVHGFDDLETMAKTLNASGDCHYDVNCSIGTGYELQRNSVAMIINGGGLCTGSLVHNTSGTVIPYFITARHCGTAYSSWVLRFRWESPVGQTVCAGTAPSGNGPENMNVNGSMLRAQNTNSDFTLVELNTAPDPTWNIYYNGWDNSDSLSALMAFGIHHPSGDVKKISIENDGLSQQTISFLGTTNHTWVINNWDFGTTQPGSSGSPLFNQDKRLIGVLSGGTSGCTGVNDNNLPDFYGRFGYGWATDSLPSKQLKTWLDPSSTGATVIDGLDPFVGNDTIDASLATLTGVPTSLCDSNADIRFILLNSGTNPLTQVFFQYGFNGNYNFSSSWTGNLATYESAIVTLPTLSIPIGQNTFSLKVVDANGQADVDTSNNFIHYSLFRLQNDFTAKLALKLDCYGSETSWEVKDMLGNTLYNNEPYFDGQEGLYNYLFCLSDGCYKFLLYDQYGDGMSGCSGVDGGNGAYVLSNDATGVIFGELTETNGNFGFVSSLTFCVNDVNSVQEYNLENSIHLYPNPGSSELKIHTSQATLGQITVYSYTGQEIFKSDFSSNSATLDTENWPASVYLVKINTNKGELMKRWIKK